MQAWDGLARRGLELESKFTIPELCQLHQVFLSCDLVLRLPPAIDARARQGETGREMWGVGYRVSGCGVQGVG